MSVITKRIEMVSVDALVFDPDNPRLPSTLNTSDEQDLLEWLLRDGSLIELMGSIGEHGYFHGEPLLVTDYDGKLKVVEGNRRLAAVQLRLEPDKPTMKKKAVAEVSAGAVHKPRELPVVRFRQRSEILMYLGYRHVTGIKEWDTLQKARYLAQLIETLDPPMERTDKYVALAKRIGSRRSYVGRLLTGYGLFGVIQEYDYFELPDLDESSIGFSLLTTAIGYRNITDFLGLESNQDRRLDGLDVAHLCELTEWLFQREQGVTRLGESRNLGMLSRVVANERALDAFRLGMTLEDADDLTGAPTLIFREALLEARERLVRARSVSHLVEAMASGDAELLREIAQIARQLWGFVNDQLFDSDARL